jgi:hypothetical protein
VKMGRNGSRHPRGCTCSDCNARHFKRLREGGWTPREVGTIDGGEPVTFRQGTGDNEGHTLIADGDKTAREFDNSHNHYGQKREGGGRFDQDRGSYTGPGHWSQTSWAGTKTQLIKTLNGIMLTDMNENNLYNLDDVELKQSSSSEWTFLNLGVILYNSLLKASTESELRLLVGVILEYTQTMSQYGEKTGRFAESIAVDLNESIQIKLENLIQGGDDQEWQVYADQFKTALISVAEMLEVKLEIN